MDSAVLLDLLGNENRRRILRLLSHKPCYVTEISEYLGVSPKAVIDHLRKLEDAGLIESRTDDQRRKYFHISRNLRLEVNVSPYGFGAKSAYPANPELEMPSCTSRLDDVGENAGAERSELARELGKLEELDNELSLAQRWVQGRSPTCSTASTPASRTATDDCTQNWSAGSPTVSTRCRRWPERSKRRRRSSRKHSLGSQTIVVERTDDGWETFRRDDSTSESGPSRPLSTASTRDLDGHWLRAGTSRTRQRPVRSGARCTPGRRSRPQEQSRGDVPASSAYGICVFTWSTWSRRRTSREDRRVADWRTVVTEQRAGENRPMARGAAHRARVRAGSRPGTGYPSSPRTCRCWSLLRAQVRLAASQL